MNPSCKLLVLSCFCRFLSAPAQAQDGQSQAELHPPQDQFLHEGF
jgi:hypothetical protein